MINWFELIWRKNYLKRELLMLEIITKSEMLGESIEDLEERVNRVKEKNAMVMPK